jgi:hypothetical protein
MMSLSTIRDMSREAGVTAAVENRTPYVLWDEDEVSRLPGGPEWDGVTPFPFPNLGDHEPEGWVNTGRRFFVDTSGMGADDEPALTWAQFNEKLREVVGDNRKLGLGITEVGQFQLYVDVFEKDEEPVGPHFGGTRPHRYEEGECVYCGEADPDGEVTP